MQKTLIKSMDKASEPDRCVCGNDMPRIMSPLAQINVGAIIKRPHLPGEPEMTYSDYQKYLKQNNLQEAGDKVGGSTAGVFGKAGNDNPNYKPLTKDDIGKAMAEAKKITKL